jgi:hypothetical protein
MLGNYGGGCAVRCKFPGRTAATARATPQATATAVAARVTAVGVQAAAATAAQMSLGDHAAGTAVKARSASDSLGGSDCDYGPS